MVTGPDNGGTGVATSVSTAVRQWSRGRATPFARASEEPYRRRTTDAFRVALSTGGVIWLPRDSGHSSDLSLAVFRALNGLPGGLKPLFENVYRASALWAVLLVAGAAGATPRRRLPPEPPLPGLFCRLVPPRLRVLLPPRLPPRPP